MQDFHPLVQQYIDIWNEGDTEKRRNLIEKTWTDSSSYTDPLVTVEGHAGINIMVEGVRNQFPQHEFKLSGSVDGYQNRLRFSWDLITPTGTALAQGTDFATVSGDGRLQTVVGFIDSMPAA